MRKKEEHTLGRMIGRTIQNVIWSTANGVDHCYLCFADGSHAELYSSSSELRFATDVYMGNAEKIKARLECDGVEYVMR